ncbi:hypothetical protein NDU88_000805 [Pleurodeles waltl]|uniref:Uncharacterized protein n=1 Tax=Pleurodeles waltl TaxID=8319 RepID=A0AAV7USV5_PLEWA|nr:hypothetical protein NDU88_000805 [Pleurodeles waltl]
MDARVVRAMELLKKAGRLDLLAAPAAPRDRPVRRAASGVAAAVAACSPPRERKQGAQGRSEDGDPGELLVGSEPWEEEEEVLAGPSAASWTGCRRGDKAVRATEVITHATSGKGLAPPGGWGNKGKRPGYALQREGVNTPLRRPRIPAAPIEEFIKKARFGIVLALWDQVHGGNILVVLSLGAGACGDRERAHDRRERMGRKEDKTNID